jgi:hypothetical protein
MTSVNAPLRITLYGVNDEIKKELTRSIVPWGILERAIDLQDVFQNIDTAALANVSRDQIEELTSFVTFIFDDQVTADELKRGASLEDMFTLYTQIFTIVFQVMQKNPMIAQATPEDNLMNVRQGRKRR